MKKIKVFPDLEITVPEHYEVSDEVHLIFKNYIYPLLNIFYSEQIETIIDVGANVGGFSLFFSQNFPEAEVYAFEPDPEIYEECLRKNLDGNKNIKLFNFGLSNVDEETLLYRGVKSSLQNSMHKTDAQFLENPIQIIVKKLSKLLTSSKIDILKIDTEGNEVQVLEDLISNNIKLNVIYVEHHFEEDRIKIEKLLEKTHTLHFSRGDSRQSVVIYISNDLISKYDCIFTKTRITEDFLHMNTRYDLPSYLNNNNLLGVGVEVGVFKGEFAKYILEIWKGRKLYLIDSWRYLPGTIDVLNGDANFCLDAITSTMKNIYGFRDRATVIRDFSVNAAKMFNDDSLDFVYLDASHDYDNVYSDLGAWYPKIRSGGLLMGDDYIDGLTFGTKFEVYSAVNDYFRLKNKQVNVVHDEATQFYVIK